MKRVIITGSGGYLGSAVIQQMLHQTDSVIYAVTSQPEKVAEKYAGEQRVVCIGNECLEKQELPQADVLLHLAFARRFSTDQQIAQSIAFSRTVFEAAKACRIPGLIYVSSQGVYGNTPNLRDVENTPVSPAGLYTLAKFAAEEVLWAVLGAQDSKVKCTAVRLDSIAGNQKMLPAFVANAIEKQAIHVVGGSQVFSFMDVRDAASGLMALIDLAPEKWQKIYNLGPHDRRFTIVDLAELTAKVAAKRGYGKVNLTLEKKDIAQFAGMNAEPFMQDTGWKPQYSMEDIIDNLFDEYLAKSK